jgi:hypothetical protein
MGTRRDAASIPRMVGGHGRPNGAGMTGSNRAVVYPTNRRAWR